MTPKTATAPVPGRSLFRIVTAASIGNALEWFDILIYGYFAVTISKLFFPNSDQTVSLMLAFGTFGVSYLMRPLGAIVLGAYGDRAGRKASLTLSILLMTAGTLLMAVMPTYASIGPLAPAAVLIARLMQGFAIGGEFGASTAFLVEHGPNRKGFFASFQWAGQGLAAVLASAFGIAITSSLTPDAIDAWGWRVPYFFGLLIGPIGLYIRRQIDETPEFLAAETTRSPVAEVFVKQWDRVLLAIGAAMVSTGSNYLILYMPTFAIKQLSLSPTSGFIATFLGGSILTLGSPLAGYCSDKIGRTRIMLTAAFLFAVTAYPAFLLLTSFPVLSTLILVVCWLSLLKTAYSGVLASMMAELFPTRTRCTGIALSYNISVPVFGGFAPLISTWLIELTGSKLAPSFYLTFTAFGSLAALLWLHYRAQSQSPAAAQT